MKKFTVMLLAIASLGAMAQSAMACGQPSVPAGGYHGAKASHAQMSEDPVIRSFQRVIPGYQPVALSGDPVIRSFQMVIPGYQP